MTFYEAAIEVLREAGRPLHYKKITELSLKRALLSHVGRTPEATMRARLAQESTKQEGDSAIVAVRSGVFSLREGVDLATTKQTIQLKVTPAVEEPEAAPVVEEAAAEPVETEVAEAPEVETAKAEAAEPSEREAVEASAVEASETESTEVAAEAAAETDAPATKDRREKGRSRRRSRRHRDADRPRVLDAPAVVEVAGADTPDEVEAPAAETVSDEASVEADGAQKTESSRRRRRGRRGGRNRTEARPERAEARPTQVATGDHDSVDLGEVSTVVAGGGELAKVILDTLRQVGRSVPLDRLAKLVSERGFGAAKRLGPGAIRGALNHANRRQMSFGRPPLFVESRPSAWRVAMASGAELAKSYLALDRWQTSHREVLKAALVQRISALDAEALCTVVTLLVERLDYSDIASHPAIGDEVSTLGALAPRGLTSARVAVRIANPDRTATREDVMAFRGSLHIYGAGEGVVVAAGGVADGAREEGVVPNLPQISLLSIDELAEMMIHSGVGVSRFQVAVSYLDESFFQDYVR